MLFFCLLEEEMPVIGKNPFADYFTIDLGTTNSAVSIIMNNQVVSVDDEQGYFTFPSCVAYTRAGPIVGLSAKNRISSQKDPVVTNSKRLIGQSKSNIKDNDNYLFGVKVDWVGEFPKFDVGGVYVTPTDVAKDILLYAKKLAERKMGEGAMKNVVITVPAYFHDDQRRATREAARQAGLNVYTLLEEPIAATLSYSSDNKCVDEEDQRIVLVFDFGGGTLDVSIVKITKDGHFVLNTGGNNCLGGSDIDLKIAVEVMNQFEETSGYPLIDFECDENAEKLFNKLKKDCEAAKKSLSVTEEVNIDLTPYILVDEDEEEEDDEDDDLSFFTLKASDLEEWSKEFMDRCKTTILDCIAGANLTIEDITQVITVGGSSYLHCVKSMLEGLFHNKVYCDAHPERCVSRGAAEYLLNSFTEKKVIMMKTSYDVCIELGNGELAVMIPKGIDLPTSGSNVFTTLNDLQSDVPTSLCQKNPDGSVQKLRPITLHNVPLMRRGEPRLQLTVSISKTGDFTLTCIETTHNQKVQVLMQEISMK